MKLSSIFLTGLLFVSGVVSAELRTITLSIPKMYCSLCPITVETALNKLNGVTEVQADLDTKSVVVTFDDATIEIESLTEATANAGYPSEVVQ